ncbi:hypothetical protein [Lysinibacillus sp. JNUCC-52]|uniref:hypothetical protein n=1 Tax=Lysinibacillus sp. JNUCC-52 TaxID=2792480 RepID=UPI001938B3CB|nr:hypothetical protein JNUCC52_16450 [Lysinibacillus sp. JNUCC-52]
MKWRQANGDSLCSTKEDMSGQHFVIVVKVSVFLVKVVIFNRKNVMIIGMVNFIQPYCYQQKQ